MIPAGPQRKVSLVRLQKADYCSQAFSSKAWLRQCNTWLVSASAGIDDLCRSIVRTKVHFRNDTVSRELGDLALTVSVLERSIFAYARKIRVRHDQAQSHPALLEEGLDAAASSSAKSGSSVLDSRILWKHPGAVLSLLDLLSDCLDRIKEVLIHLENEATFIAFIRTHKSMISRFVIACLGFLALRSSMRGSKRVNSVSNKSTRSWISARSFFNCCCVIILSYWFYRWWLYQRLAKLRSLHNRLSTLMRFWHLCMSELNHDPDNKDAKASVKTPPSPKVSMSSRTITSTAIPIPISRWMLDLVGVANIWYDYIYDSDKDLWFLWYTYSILYSAVSIWYKVCGNSIRWYGTPVAVLAAIYYALRPGLAADTTSDLLSSIYVGEPQGARRLSGEKDGSSKAKMQFNPAERKLKLAQLKEAFSFYDNLITDSKRRWGWLWSKIGLGTSDWLIRFRNRLTWYWPMRWFCFYSVSVMGVGSLSGGRISNAYHSRTDPRRLITILKPARWMSVISTGNCATSVVFFIHGGGWIANFLNSDLTFLRAWTEAAQVPIVVFDYSLKRSSSKFSYTAALKSCYEAYQYVCNNQIDLGYKPSKVVVAGDSVGARIAVALCMRVINEYEKSIPIPSNLVLAYPPLNVSLMSSPSRAVFMVDPIVPMSLLNQNGDWEVPESFEDIPNIIHEKAEELKEEDSRTSSDPRRAFHQDERYFSPLTASDAVLKKFPQTSLMVGSIDPFLDDSVDFAHRLSAVGVPCRLKVFKNFPHGFLGFQTMLPRAEEAVDLGARWIQESISPASSQVPARTTFRSE